MKNSTEIGVNMDLQKLYDDLGVYIKSLQAQRDSLAANPSICTHKEQFRKAVKEEPDKEFIFCTLVLIMSILVKLKGGNIMADLYDLYMKEHLRAVTDSGYYHMTLAEKHLVQLMSIQTYHSFLQSIEIVQKCLTDGITLEGIKKAFNLKDT